MGMLLKMRRDVHLPREPWLIVISKSGDWEFVLGGEREPGIREQFVWAHKLNT